METLLEIDDLCVTYPDGTRALRGVSLRLSAGQRTALIGPNGSGKTTLLLAILRGVSSRGRIAVDGVELTGRTVEEVRRRCGMMFQDADDQLFMPTLLEDVAFGPLNQGLSEADAVARAQQAIEAVGLAGLEKRSAHHLSGGQKRSAALATVAAMNAQLLLMDEPAANLDFRGRRRLVDLLATRPEAMLLATHDLDLVRQLCSRVVLLDDGQVAAEGETGAILGDIALLSRHGLG